jgi:hypothetical protein
MAAYGDTEEIRAARALWKSIIKHGAYFSRPPNSSLLSGSVVCVGSGCSLAVAKLLERQLSAENNAIHTCCTPYEFVRSNVRCDVGILISSKGRHLDAIECYKEMLRRTGSIILVTTASSTPLGDLALATPERTTVIWPKVSVPNDGFLPFAPTVALAALLTTISPVAYQPDPSLSDLFDRALSDHKIFVKSAPDLNEIRAFHIIATLWGRAAGQDLETRLAESGIGVGVVSDPWDIAHGRYMSIQSMWRSQCMVMIGVAKEGTDFEKLSGALPDDVPRCCIVAPFPKFAGSLYCLFRTMCMVSWLCDLKGVDPANPERPKWGDQLFGARQMPE